MHYVRPVDFDVFPAAAFHSHRLADVNTGLDSCICLLTRVPPGTGTSTGLHTHPVDQLYYVLSGRMHARVGDTAYTVEPESLVIIPAGVAHWNWNEGSQDEVHFEVIVPQPGAGQPIVTRLEHEPPAQPVRLAAVRALQHELFAAEQFSQVVLADRSTGLESVSLGVFRVPVGGRSPGLHAHRFDQIYYVYAGEMQLEIGFERYTAGPHTLVTIPAGMPHRNWNSGSQPEYHVNLRIPEPLDHDREWDVPVTLGSEARS